MTEYLSPGVYIEEFEMGARPIEGVTTETDQSNYGLLKLGRNNYFYGKLMTVRDFQDEQEYFTTKRFLLNRIICGWVVASSNGNPNQTFKVPVPAEALVRVWTTESEGLSSTQWEPAPDLLDSSPVDTHFVVDNDTAEIRFGDDVHGRIPPSGEYNIQIFYYYGPRKYGDSLSLLLERPLGIREVTNPIPATGGVDPQSINEVRQGAPLSFFRMIQKKKFEELDLSKLQIERLQQIITDFKASIEVKPQGKNKFIALFQGAGTGKTIAAEVIANELYLNLHRIDLSNEVTKYNGETEKNLRRIFESAEDGGAILLFDEADALFGKRSEVRDSHDRYANIKISYLLQRIEKYSGLVILSSKKVIYPQYLPKFRYIIKFPLKSRKKKLHY